MKLNKEEIISIIKGSSIFATGGGGSLEYALYLASKIESVNLVRLDDLQEDDCIFTAFAVGSISNEDNLDIYLENILNAKNKLEAYVNKKFSGIIPVEIGPCSLAETFYLAYLMNIPVIDSDVVGGRCSPELFLETISLNNIDRTPLLYITKEKLSEIINEKDPYNLENILRTVSANANSYVYVVGYPMKIKEAKDFLNKFSVSNCLPIGKCKNIYELESTLKCKTVFFGTICSIDQNDMDGFIQGYINITGLGVFSGKEMNIYFKNENLIAWIDGDVVVSCPDLISIVNGSNTGVNNNCLVKNIEVYVLAISAIKLWKTDKGIEIFCPKTFGFNIDYKPIQTK